MKDQYKTKKQLIEEVEVLRKQLVKLKKAETKRRRVEETTQTTNERLNYLLTSTSAAIYTAKTSGDYGATSVTENIKQMTGYEPREFIENSSFWIDHVHPEDRERILNELPRILEQESYIYEYRFLHRDGNYRWVRDDMKLIRDAFENPIEIIGYWIDITERKQAEEALRKSAEQYRIITSTSMDGFAIVDVAGRLLDVNEVYSRMIGYNRDELLKMSVSDIEAKATPEEIQTQHKKAMADSQLFESRHRRKDGRIIDVEVSMTFMRQSGQIFVFLRDIAKRKQAKEALQESEERFRLAFENANTGMCLVDLHGNLTKVNKKMCEIFGYTKQELERMTVNDIAHPEDIDKSPEFIQETLQGKIHRGTFEKRYIHKKGHVVTCQVSSSLVRNADGLPLYFISHILIGA